MVLSNYYTLNSVLSNEDRSRIKSLRIPPNWKNVKISKDPSNKIQVTGEDVRGRTQYIYHPIWTLFSKETNYTKINSINFNKLNSILNKYNKKSESFNKNYIIANMIILMKDLNIRVGNDIYLEENDSVGICTMSKSHFKKDKLVFKGKKGIMHEKQLNKYHINFINKLLKIPGKSLFKYYDIDTNSYKKITANDINNFLKINIDENMTCKDIRTYSANNIFTKEYNKLLKNGISQNKAKIEAIKYTAHELGNTPKVCRDSYINPNSYL